MAGLVLSAQVAVRLARHVLGSGIQPAASPSTLARPGATDGLLTYVPIEPGMRVLQIGSPHPAFVGTLARRVGKYGKVYVLESSGERAEGLGRQLRAERVGNVEVLTGDPARLELPDCTFDLALCVQALADQPRRQRTLWELQRVLRPRGHLSVSESLRPWRYLSRGTLKNEASAVGLVCRDEHGTPLAYTANFRKLA
ncbi:MAG TPA: methyltransferase domain-containing protein [Chloroflexota bacterium]|nr:methyltransferase domain-containing protein [Chloroflexota bacterium]